MRRFLINWFVLGLAVLVAAYILPGIVVDGLLSAIVAALVLGLVNAFVRPVLFILTLPLTVFSLGIFYLILNALLLYLVAALVSGFVITNFFSALIGSITIAIIGAMIHALIGK